jgi:hypothetical protein
MPKKIPSPFEIRWEAYLDCVKVLRNQIEVIARWILLDETKMKES